MQIEANSFNTIQLYNLFFNSFRGQTIWKTLYKENNPTHNSLMQNVRELVVWKLKGTKSLDAIFNAFKLVFEQSEHSQRAQKLICSLFLAPEKITNDILTALDIFHPQSLETEWGNERKDSF